MQASRSHMSASQSLHYTFSARRTWKYGCSALLSHLGLRTPLFLGLGAVMLANAGCTSEPQDRVDFPHNPIEFSTTDKAVVLVAASPNASCSVARASQLHIYKTSGQSGQRGNKWVGGFGLNAAIFISDSATHRIFVQAFQFDPGEYRLDLRVLPTGAAPNSQPYATATIRLSAGEVRYIGNLQANNCGASTLIRQSNDWALVNATFLHVYPSLPVDAVKVCKPLADTDVEPHRFVQPVHC